MNSIRRTVWVTTAGLLASLGAVAGLTAGSAGGVATATPHHQQRCAQPGPYELPHGSEPVDLDPADFTTAIDNRYWPMVPGTRWEYVETDGHGSRERVEVTVTHRTKTIRGIEARVVHDVVTDHGNLVENTFDWYAQDSGGTVWYLGEYTREYEDGEVVSTAGSFEYGVDGAQAGVAVPAVPVAGCGYRQEYYEGEAEDRGRVLTTRDRIKAHGQAFRQVLTTSDRVPLEPFVLEHKFYAAGVGPVLSIGVSPRGSREVLVAVSH